MHLFLTLIILSFAAEEKNQVASEQQLQASSQCIHQAAAWQVSIVMQNAVSVASWYELHQARPQHA